jgi:hypothetical protein
MNSLRDLEGLIYNEHLNLINIIKILQNKEDIIKNLSDKQKKKLEDKLNKYDFFMGLKKIYKNKNDIIQTTYKHSKNLENYGRLFACNSSLQNLPKEFRNAIATNYHDIDMVNAHPCILHQYCIKNGIKCDNLELYINNREKILNDTSLKYSIDRSDAKDLYLSIINGRDCFFDDDFIFNFKKEIKLIHKYIISLEPSLYKSVKNKKDFNAEGSMMNIILCKIENTILLTAVQYLKSLGFYIDVLIFDGFMIRKVDGFNITDDLLYNLSKYVLDKTGFNITFLEKEIKTNIDLSKYPDPLIDEKEEETYFKDKEEFEKTHCKIVSNGTFISILSDGTINKQKENEFIISYKDIHSTLIIDGVLQKINFIKYWLLDPNKRKYEQMKFLPPPLVYDASLYYNTWSDFDNEKISLPDDFNINTNEYILRYLKFINNLFDFKKEFVNYYLAWCANIIQYPASRSTVCMVLYDYDEGSGKNMSTDTLKNCVGNKYCFSITDVGNQLFGKHSAPELDRLLITLNEVKGKDTYSNTDLFKSRITDKEREVELKNKDCFIMNNYASYILNTNNMNAVNAGIKDRRFVILPCNNKKINDKEYFNKYELEINQNKEAIRCIYEYLKQFDINKVIPNRLFQSHRPKSDIYNELVDSNREKEYYLIRELVIDNLDKPELKIEMKELWYKYKMFCNSNNYKLNISDRRFYLIISQLIIADLNKKNEFKDAFKKFKSNSKDYYIINIKLMKLYFNIEDDDI